MASSQPTLKNDAALIAAWAVLLPGLAFWPFLSAMPAFTLLGKPESGLAIMIQAGLLVTGFWGIPAALAVFYVLLNDEQRAFLRLRSVAKGLVIGGYSALWTAGYCASLFVIA